MSNEQRAHDITMLYIRTLTNVEYKQALSNATDGMANLKIDFYEKYMEIYPNILELVNRDFPNEK